MSTICLENWYIFDCGRALEAFIYTHKYQHMLCTYPSLWVMRFWQSFLVCCQSHLLFLSHSTLVVMNIDKSTPMALGEVFPFHTERLHLVERMEECKVKEVQSIFKDPLSILLLYKNHREESFGWLEFKVYLASRFPYSEHNFKMS